MCFCQRILELPILWIVFYASHDWQKQPFAKYISKQMYLSFAIFARKHLCCSETVTEYCEVFRTAFFNTSSGCFCNEFLGNQDLRYMIEKKIYQGTDVEINPLTVKMDILRGKSWFYQNSLIVTCFLYFLNLSKPLVDF